MELAVVAMRIVVPFVGAGTVRWPAAWAHLAVVGGVLLAHGRYVAKRNPARIPRELPGYAQYARRVRYRLVPGVW